MYVYSPHTLSFLYYYYKNDKVCVLSFSAAVQTSHGAHPASCTMGTGSFLGLKSGQGVKLTPNPLLVLWSRKSRTIPLLPLWAVQPIQSHSACTRVHFYVDYLGCQPLNEKLYDWPNKITLFCQHYCMVGKILWMWGILSKTLKSQIRRSLRLSLAIQEVTELARALSMHAYSFIYICICVYIIFLKLLKYHIHYTVFFILCLSLFLTHRVTRQSTSLIWVAAQKDEQTLPYSLC